MGRMQRISIDPVLTELVRGGKPQNLYFDKLFPIVQVKKEQGKIPAYTSVLDKDYDTIRAIRAGSNVRQPGDVDYIRFLCTEHDITVPLDYREIEESDLPLEMRETMTNQQIIFRKIEKMAAELATSTDNFADGNVVTLSGGDCFDKDSSHPLKIMNEVIRAMQKKLGANYELNAVIGAPVWDVLKEHPDFTEKIKYSMKGVMTTALLKEIVGLNGEIFIADFVDNGDFLWGDNIVFAVVPKRADSVYTPSYGFTFRKKGFPRVDTFDDNGGKIKNIRYTDIFDIKVMDKAGGYLISNCIS
ncbi:MAG: hypothetical protein J1G30_04230 [Spirochaetales bacterium]|nr:hypothetical protein [Spirochaetales bacterium]